VHDLQPQHFLKRIEIVVPMQKFVFGLQTESGNQAIDGLTDGIALLTQVSVVPGGCDAESGSASLEDLEPQEFGLDLREHVLIPNTLQYLTKDQICQAQSLPLQFPVEPTRLWIFGSA
jgi:hypothetical protein